MERQHLLLMSVRMLPTSRPRLWTRCCSIRSYLDRLRKDGSGPTESQKGKERVLTKEQKEWIDNASYEQLLRKWRFAAVGDPMFSGDTFEHYDLVMREKRSADPAGHVRASKAIG